MHDIIYTLLKKYRTMRLPLLRNMIYYEGASDEAFPLIARGALADVPCDIKKKGYIKMTVEEMYELLTEENKEKINRQIEIYIASQSDHRS